MAKSNNPKAAPVQTNDEDDLDAQVNAALESAPAILESATANREAADLEEQLAAQRIAAAKAASADAEKGVVQHTPQEEEPLSQVAAKGRDYLMQKMREHSERPKPAYVPPPITASMQTKINEEMEAGRRAIARAEAQQAARPVPPRDPRDGTTTPVFQPGHLVPDPKGGNGIYDASA